MPKTKPATVDEYIENAPEEAREMLGRIRALLKELVPNANEVIKWNVPVVETDRILFSYSAHKTHINFMPTRSTLEAMMEHLDGYETGRDTIKLPYDKPLPLDLLRRVGEYRVQEVGESALWKHLDS